MENNNNNIYIYINVDEVTGKILTARELTFKIRKKKNICGISLALRIWHPEAILQV